jgi:hypothetical protein
VLLKLNPVNEYLAPHLDVALRPLIRGGWLRIVTGGPDVARAIIDHPDVDTVHLTGSDRTYEAIVFGDDDEAGERKRRGTRCARSRSPPSSATSRRSSSSPDRGRRARSPTTATTSPRCSCRTPASTASRHASIVQHAAWSRRDALNDAIRDSLRRAEPRDRLLPGGARALGAFTAAHPEAERFGSDEDGEVPFTFIPDLDATRADDIAFTTEAFCAVFGEVPLDAPRSVPEFLEQAVDFCNERLWGTLSASLIVHPRTLNDPASREAVERAIDRLDYGSVVVNHWSAAPYAMVTPPWGAARAATPTDIQSGNGFVHNTFLLEDVAKTVVRGRSTPGPPAVVPHPPGAQPAPAPDRAAAGGPGSLSA